MSGHAKALAGATRIFDGETWHEGAALLVRGGQVEGIVPADAVPGDFSTVRLEGGLLAPGFVDLQVNGGGGVMLNGAPTVETIETICKAHQRFGTTALLPTLITDTPEVARQAIAAGQEAAGRVPGFLGLHLEGPHLSVARKGAHDPKLIRPMTEADLRALCEAKAGLPVLLVTLAPESVSLEKVERLAEAGVLVSLGHTDTGLAAARKAAEAGARLVTHLFNAQSQLGNREPGVVGAALDLGQLWAGLIADGFHVDPASIGIALRAKRGPGKIFLVSDAMAVTGTDLAHFTLNGRTIHRRDGRLTLEDGTLAGADLDLGGAVRFMHERMGLDLGEALRMASLYPAQAAGVAPAYGTLKPGSRADFVHLSEDLAAQRAWIAGIRS